MNPFQNFRPTHRLASGYWLVFRVLSLTNPVKACESALFEGWYWQVWLWTPYLIDPQCIFGIHATVRESAMHFFPFVYFFNWNVRVEYVCTLHYITGMLYSRKCCNLGILLDIHIAIVLCCSWYARIMYVYAALRWSTMFFIIEFFSYDIYESSFKYIITIYMCTLHYIAAMLYYRKCCRLDMPSSIHIATGVCYWRCTA